MSRFTHPLVVLRGPSLSDLAFVLFGAFKCVFGTKEPLRALEECQDLSSLNVLSAVTGNHPACFSVLLHKKALLILDNLLGCGS